MTPNWKALTFSYLATLKLRETKAFDPVKTLLNITVQNNFFHFNIF